MEFSQTSGRKKLGLVLQEAALITPAQLEVALNNQQHFDYLIGEVIALHGWVSKDTIDFFAEQWFELIHRPNALPLGHYLQMASLLEQPQIDKILTEQKKLGLRFGATAVLMGWLKQETVDYFIANLKAEMASHSAFSTHELNKGTVERIRRARTTTTTTKTSSHHKTQKRKSSPEKSGQTGHSRVLINKAVVDLPSELVGGLPDNFDIFATDNEDFDLANLMEMDDGNISF